jgi:hypothetical protein
MGRKLLAESPSRDPLEGVDKCGELHSGRELDKKMDVVVLSVEFCQAATKVGAYIRHHLLTTHQHLLG